MSMTPLRKHVALAIDGGGIRGLVVAQALIALEDELGGGPLIQRPQLKVLAGTSTGAIITAAISMGMKAEDIARVFIDMGQKVFPPLAPAWFPKPLEQADELMRGVLQPFVYSNERLIDLLKMVIQQQTGKADLTLAELNERLGPDKTLILTTVDINERRTRFLKTYQEDNGDWKLWEAILASSSAPISLPVWSRLDAAGKPIYYTDGGVGNYGHPAYVAAQEAVVFLGYAPQDVSVLSFGTGWMNRDNFERANGVPTGWHGLDWAKNAPRLLTGDTSRAQSLDISEGFGDHQIDFRRFQFALETDISGDAYSDDATYDLMKKLGNELGERIRRDQFAPNADAQYDPEGLYASQLKYRAAKETGKSHRSI
jgi:patatin-like phospholipase/acyl hydrolase